MYRYQDNRPFYYCDMDVHIGKEIEKIYRQSGMKLSEFAKRINTSARNAYSIFSRKEIKTDQLQKISNVLGFNFFLFYQPDLASSTVSEPSVPYKKTTRKITISLELDGSSNTLNFYIRKISELNRLLRQDGL